MMDTVADYDLYRIPRVDECIASLGDAPILSTLEAYHSYWQVKNSVADPGKTTFSSPHWLYTISGVLFGLHNKSGKLQRTIHVVLFPVKWRSALGNPEDVIIFLLNSDNHILHDHTVPSLFFKVGVTLKLKNWSMFTKMIDNLGHLIGPGSLKLGDHTSDKIFDMKSAWNETELKLFRGLVYEDGLFDQNFALMDAPLHKRLEQ